MDGEVDGQEEEDQPEAAKGEETSCKGHRSKGTKVIDGRNSND